MQTLAEIVGLRGKEDVGAFKLAWMEAKKADLFYSWRLYTRLYEWVEILSEILAMLAYACQSLFLLGLERQSLQLALLSLQILQRRTSCVSRNLDAPVANWAGKLLVFLHLATGDLKTFAVVPLMTQLALDYHTTF